MAGVLAAAATYPAAAALTGGADAPPPRPVRAAATAAPAPPGRAVFSRMGCGGCHHLTAANARGQIGPDLDFALAGHTRASLKQQILDPYPGSRVDAMGTMPEDFGEQLTPAELDQLVTFLLATRR